MAEPPRGPERRSDITSPDDVRLLVRRFYQAAIPDPMLGPVFHAAGIDWVSGRRADGRRLTPPQTGEFGRASDPGAGRFSGRRAGPQRFLSVSFQTNGQDCQERANYDWEEGLMSRRFRTAVLSVAVTAAMVGTGSAAFAATPGNAEALHAAPRATTAVTAADRDPGGRDAHRGDDGRHGDDNMRRGDNDAHRGDNDAHRGDNDAHRGDDGRRDGVHGDRRDHRDFDHGRWYGNGWDHRGDSWYGWNWEQQCEWAWYNDPAWYNEYCG